MRIYYVITHVKHLIMQMKFHEDVIHQLLVNMLNSRFFFPSKYGNFGAFFSQKSFRWVRLDFIWWPRDENFPPKKPLYKSHWISFGHQVVKLVELPLCCAMFHLDIYHFQISLQNWAIASATNNRSFRTNNFFKKMLEE
jgi:uncharacterized metal-binding protein